MTFATKSTGSVPYSKRLSAQTAIAGCFLLASGTLPAIADAPSVVTTIKPLHSIASAVMEGVGTPHIIIDGAASPHGFALKPSQAFLLQGADVVFWIGPSLTPSLAKPISSMATNATTVELMDATSISHLPYREGANFDAHDHGDHDEHAEHGDHDDHEEHAEHDHDKHDDHEEHAEHDHDKHDDHEEHAEHDHDKHDHEEHADHDHDEHDHEEHAEHDHDKHDDHEEHAEHDHDEHDHEEHAEHAHDEEKHDDHADAGHSDEHGHDHAGGKDPHIWLNPDNGIAIAGAMAETLSKADPENADTYKKNAAAFAERIEALEAKIGDALKPAEGKKFVVFHDAYHHFEHHFDFEASGAITVSPEAVASANRVAEIQKQIKDLGVTCVFQEPQFDAKLVDVVIEGSGAQKGTLDPLGTELSNGPDLYPELLSGLSASLADCLSGQS